MKTNKSKRSSMQVYFEVLNAHEKYTALTKEFNELVLAERKEELNKLCEFDATCRILNNLTEIFVSILREAQVLTKINPCKYTYINEDGDTVTIKGGLKDIARHFYLYRADLRYLLKQLEISTK